MLQSIQEKIWWMQWTLPSIIFLGGIFFAIAVIGIVEKYVLIVERKGFLPIPTTPGDRLFISILYSIGVFFLWMAFFQDSMMIIPSLIAIIGVFFVAIFG